MVKVALDVDSDGYIIGWTEADFAVSGATLTEIDENELATVADPLGASKLTDGHVVKDDTKAAELTRVTPTAEQQLIAALSLQIAQLEAKS